MSDKIRYSKEAWERKLVKNRERLAAMRKTKKGIPQRGDGTYTKSK